MTLLLRSVPVGIYLLILLRLSWTSSSYYDGRGYGGRASCNRDESRSTVGAGPTTTTTTCLPVDTTSDIFEQILKEDYEGMDSSILPNCVAALKDRGAHRCWHKHSTFLDHLLGVHHILRLWGQGRVIGRVGLLHSAYSNSYVNLALYDPTSERAIMQDMVGTQAESLVYLFCIIDRQQVVVNTLLRQGFIPKEGLSVPHLRSPGETVFLSAETLRMLLVFTMADTADQYFGWQDQLFGGGGIDGSMIIPGQDIAERHDSRAIWPGISKPGLWMSYVSDLGRVVRTFDADWPSANSSGAELREGDQTLDIPPVFDSATQTLSVEDEAEARDLYWSIVAGRVDGGNVVATLEACCEKNPWAFEPLVVLAQAYLHRNDYDTALIATNKAMDLQRQWGTAWDKRLSFGAWVSWTRVLHQRAMERLPWPENSWDVNNFGLVK
jgi:hypothetical protein